MGIYLNPGNENFKKTLYTGRYVDKTGLIAEINRFIDTGNSTKSQKILTLMHRMAKGIARMSSKST